jgi:uncharacterized repeat protein (TIGR03803 family)
MTVQARSNLSQYTHAAAALLLAAAILGATCIAQTVKAVASFPGAGAEAAPQVVTPAQGRNGELYGTTSGASGSYGSLFEASPTGSLRFPFEFSSTGGGQPSTGVVLATDGNFYGTTPYGGTATDGVLYKITPSGVYTVLHDFQGGADGQNPFVAPIEGSDGSIYGVTDGTAYADTATLFKYTSSGSYSIVYTFGEGYGPTSLIQAANGNFYATTSGGGTDGCGEIFEISTSGSLVWSYSFPCTVGGPTQILQAADGNFYGPTFGQPGGANYGTIFELNQEGSVTVLYSFPDNLRYGSYPVGLMQATDGNLYGVAEGGGQYNDGTFFQITTSGDITVLCNFNGKTGTLPLGAPVQHTDGTFYGTTESGGKANAGVVYSLSMGLGPFVKLVLPTGKVSQTAQILGQGLTGTTAVTFNGFAATSFKVVSDTFMTAVIPSGATTGPVVVTTPSGALTSNVSFRVIP